MGGAAAAGDVDSDVIKDAVRSRGFYSASLRVGASLCRSLGLFQRHVTSVVSPPCLHLVLFLPRILCP